MSYVEKIKAIRQIQELFGAVRKLLNFYMETRGELDSEDSAKLLTMISNNLTRIADIKLEKEKYNCDTGVWE